MLGFFGLLQVIWAIIPIAAIVIAVRASRQTKQNAIRLKFAEEHIDQLERTLSARDQQTAPPEPQASPAESSDIPTEEQRTSEPSIEPDETATAAPSVPSITPTHETSGDDSSQVQSPSQIQPSFEERLGTKWAVYVGGIALAIGGILLVRYSIEAGLIGPGTRVALGALFSAALLAAGEWFRRRDIDLGVQERFAAHIPSVLTAAGTIAAFATIYASYALYNFISGGTAFVLLGLVGIATLIASALHGPALAALGIVGSHVTPLLVSSQSPNPWALVLYLAILSAAALTLARLRQWTWLVAANIIGVFIWGVLLSFENVVDLSDLWANATFTHVILQTLLLAALLVFIPYLNQSDEEAETDWVALGALAALSVLFVFIHQVISFQYVHWMTAALVMITLLAVTGYFNAVTAATTVLAGTLIVTTLYIWSNKFGGIAPPLPPTLFGRIPENVSTFLNFAAVTSLGLTAATAHRLYRGTLLAFTPSLSYVIAMTAPILLTLSLSYLRVTHFDYSISFGLAGALLAGLFAILADRFDKRGSAAENRVGHMVASVAAVATVAALSFALVTCLGRGYLTVAFALTALAAAVVAIKRDFPILRYVLIPIGLVILGRLIWDPRIVDDVVGNWPILNWLLVGYGVPAASFAGAAFLLRKNGLRDVTVQFSEALALLFAALLVFFEIRHYIHDGDILAQSTGHVEMGLFAITSLGFSFAISRLFTDPNNLVFQSARIAFAVLTGLIAIIGLATTQNPYFSGELVAGMSVISSLLPAYLLPGIFALYVARAVREEPQNKLYALFVACLGLALVFAYVTLEVRHAFHGENIGISVGTTDAEMWAYNISWLALAILFLAYGLIRQSLPARIASAGLLTATVLKIGLFDLSELTGLWRALSFICLGAVLIGIGLVYQRLIFAKPVAKPSQD